MKHTSNYQLSQWDKDDRIMMEDFNSDNAKIDAALSSAGSAVSSETPDRKAAIAAETAARKAAINTINATLAKKGNCTLYTGTYTGDGTSGSAAKCSLTFSHQPESVFILSGKGPGLIMVRGAGMAPVLGTNAQYANVTWSAKGVSWYAGSAANQMNYQDTTYHVFALLDAEN